jgi:hypothetical protein
MFHNIFCLLFFIWVQSSSTPFLNNFNGIRSAMFKSGSFQSFFFWLALFRTMKEYVIGTQAATSEFIPLQTALAAMRRLCRYCILKVVQPMFQKISKRAIFSVTKEKIY